MNFEQFVQATIDENLVQEQLVTAESEFVHVEVCESSPATSIIDTESLILTAGV